MYGYEMVEGGRVGRYVRLYVGQYVCGGGGGRRSTYEDECVVCVRVYVCTCVRVYGMVPAKTGVSHAVYGNAIGGASSTQTCHPGWSG